MPNKPTPNSPEELWQGQPEEEMNMTLATIRSKALNFQNKVRRRNAIEYFAAVVTTIAFGAYIWFLPNLWQKVGSAMIIIGVIKVVYWLRQQGAARETPVDGSAGNCLDFHKCELVRQRDLLRQVGARYIGPMIPGFVVFFAGTWAARVHDGRGAVIMALTAALAVAVFAGVYWLNVRAANRLQQEIEALGE